MESIQKLRIVRIKEAYNTFGLSRASFYERIEQGIFPPSVNLGGRAVGWIESELQTVLKAFVAKKNKDEIKQLVNNLVEQRKSIL